MCWQMHQDGSGGGNGHVKMVGHMEMVKDGGGSTGGMWT